ncbi:MAG: glutathione S-transferase family protein [Alphaproteobacteria bacterium]|nr:glutathione S-transferase family protein [Alphaproteobacteria bacterium]
MIVLYDFAPSPFCIKVRAILEHKQVPYERRDIRGPAWLALRRRSPTGLVPALDVDGRLVTDSTDIARLLEARHPEPAILPSDAEDLARCRVLEDWADESLYWYGLYLRWQEPEGCRTARSAFPAGTRAALTWWVGRGARQRLQGQGLGRKPVETVLRDLDVLLGDVETLLGDDWLLGDTPWLCDFALASQLFYLSRTPRGGEVVAALPGLVAYLERFRALRGR